MSDIATAALLAAAILDGDRAAVLPAGRDARARARTRARRLGRRGGGALIPFERILVAIDGSAGSDHAFAKGLELASVLGARLFALAVEAPLPAVSSTITCWARPRTVLQNMPSVPS